ncbi:MAG: M15 family metallopeptidase [Patescibacteria group bacterium]
MTVLIRDCNFASLEEALAGKSIPLPVRNTLQLVDLEYAWIDGCVHSGQMVIAEDLVQDVVEIFPQLLRVRFPIERIVPVVAYGWSDDASMAENNSSCFNWRNMVGSDQLSLHALGRALDLNPFLNPWVKNGVIIPKGATYDPSVPGTITEDSEVVRLFEKYGWEWGGRWTSLKDYQHFEKKR